MLGLLPEEPLRAYAPTSASSLGRNTRTSVSDPRSTLAAMLPLIRRAKTPPIVGVHGDKGRPAQCRALSDQVG